jgi:osmotically-inducible protein OsmY
MKRILVAVLALMLMSTALAAQNSNAKRTAKPKAVKADCANTTDAQITDDVKARIAKATSLKDLTINVATSAGAVTLTGSAKKPTQKGTATRVARAASCVKKVDNQITVEKSMAPAAAAKKPKKTSNKNM